MPKQKSIEKQTFVRNFFLTLSIIMDTIAVGGKKILNFYIFIFLLEI